jgi:hypothetical protein
MTTNEIIQALRRECGMNHPDAKYTAELVADALESLDGRVGAVEKASCPMQPTPIDPEIHAADPGEIRGRETGTFTVENFGTPSEKVGPLVRRKKGGK